MVRLPQLEKAIYEYDRWSTSSNNAHFWVSWPEFISGRNAPPRIELLRKTERMRGGAEYSEVNR
jgi:hypothetical protein